MENDITALRETLFDTLRRLKSQDNPIEVDKARAINETAQTIVNTVKAEIEFMKVTGATQGTSFIPVSVVKIQSDEIGEAELKHPTMRITQNGMETVTTVSGGQVRLHTLR